MTPVCAESTIARPFPGSTHDDEPEGTFYFDNEPNQLDQFLVNKNMIIQTAPIQVQPETVWILRFPGTSDIGVYPKPIPFGGMGKPINQNGFSDHLPIAVIIEDAGCPDWLAHVRCDLWFVPAGEAAARSGARSRRGRHRRSSSSRALDGRVHMMMGR